jgi:hypothetical protein
MSHSHETWQGERQGKARHARGNRTIVDAFQIDADEVENKSADDEARKDEQQLDETRGLWEPTE